MGRIKSRTCELWRDTCHFTWWGPPGYTPFCSFRTCGFFLRPPCGRRLVWTSWDSARTLHPKFHITPSPYHPRTPRLPIPSQYPLYTHATPVNSPLDAPSPTTLHTLTRVFPLYPAPLPPLFPKHEPSRLNYLYAPKFPIYPPYSTSF